MRRKRRYRKTASTIEPTSRMKTGGSILERGTSPDELAVEQPLADLSQGTEEKGITKVLTYSITVEKKMVSILKTHSYIQLFK